MKIPTTTRIAPELALVAAVAHQARKDARRCEQARAWCKAAGIDTTKRGAHGQK